jgi:hypothetical protein
MRRWEPFSDDEKEKLSARLDGLMTDGYHPSLLEGPRGRPVRRDFVLPAVREKAWLGVAAIGG